MPTSLFLQLKNLGVLKNTLMEFGPGPDFTEVRVLELTVEQLLQYQRKIIPGGMEGAIFMLSVAVVDPKTGEPIMTEAEAMTLLQGSATVVTKLLNECLHLSGLLDEEEEPEPSPPPREDEGPKKD